MSEPGVTKVQMHELVAHFEKIRTEQGEEAYLKARMNFARGMVLKPRGDDFLKQSFPDLDVEALRTEEQEKQKTAPVTPPMDAQEAMLQAMRAQIPNLKTQAQFTLFMKSFDALRITLNSAFGLDKAAFETGRNVLNMALDSAFAMSEIVEKLQENPEAATSAAADEFKKPPREFQEYDTAQSLVSEVNMLSTPEELQRWYTNNRARIECVVSQSLRNELFEAIRAKKKLLGEMN